MPIAYVSSGSSPVTAERMNELAVEADRLLKLAFDEKSFYLAFAPGSFPRVEGKAFIFHEGGGSSTYGTPYDHTPFTAIAAAAVEDSTDTDKNISFVEYSSDLDALKDSLEAHKKSGKYICPILRDGSSAVIGVNPAERRTKYCVAEILLSGDFGGTAYGFTFSESFDKYNCFRIHNLTDAAVTFEFENSGFSIVVPAYGIRTVRRVDPLTGYESGMFYFWPVKTGDPRCLVNLCTALNSSLAPDPLTSPMAANNITNLEVILNWVSLLSSRVLNPYWERNPHEVYDLGSRYQNYFGDLTDTARLFGNALHHKGRFTINGAEKTFNSYETITTDLAPVNVVDEGDYLSINHALATVVPWGTNLFNPNDGTSSGTFVLGSRDLASETFQMFCFSGRNVQGIPRVPEYQNEFGSFTWYNSSDVLQTLNVTVPAFTSAPAGSIPALKPHVNTIGDILQLEEIIGSDVATNARTWANAELVLTSLGPQVLVEETINLQGVPEGNLETYLGYYSSIDTMNPESITVKRAFCFNGFGWPLLEIDSIDNQIVWERLAFLSPRVERVFSDRVTDVFEEFAWEAHPEISGDLFGTDGADFHQVEHELEHSGIRMLSTVEAEETTGSQWHKWTAPDEIFVSTTHMLRVPMLVEHFNQVASALRSIQHIKPMDHRVLFPGWGGNGLPDEDGGFSSVRPRNCYADFAFEDSTYNQFQSLGVPIKTIADLPADFDTMKNTTVTNYAAGVDFSRECIAVEELFDESSTLIGHRYTWEVSSGTYYPNLAFLNGSSPPQNLIPHTWDKYKVAFGTTAYYWVTIEDVKSAAESRGFKFYFHEQSIPLSPKVYTATEPSLVVRNDGQTYQNEDTSPTPGAEVGDVVPDPNFVPGDGVSTEDTYNHWGYWPDKLALFAEDPNGQWKADLEGYPAVTDLQQGNDLVGWIPNAATDKGIIDRLNVDDEFLIWNQRPVTDTGTINPSLAYQHRHVLFQSYCSAEMVQDTKLYLIQTKYPAHSVPNFSEFHNTAETRPDRFILTELGSNTGIEKVNISSHTSEEVVSAEEGKNKQILYLPRMYLTTI